MELKRNFSSDPMWRQVAAFLGILMFVFLADAIVSDFVPGFMQKIVGSPLLMGIIMSLSSIVGITLDLSFAKLLRNLKTHSMIFLSIVGFIVFAGLLVLATYVPWVLFLVLGVMVWGVYYEFFGFASQKFVVSIASPERRTAVWSIMETVRALAYGIGPLLGTYLLAYGDRSVLSTAMLMAVVGMFLFYFIKLRDRPERIVEHEHITLWHETKHWSVLFVHIWPMIIMGLVLGIVDATFWTTGTVVNDMLAKQSVAGGFFLTLYQISSLIVGFVLGKRMIKSGKKRGAELLMLLSGVTLSGMMLVHAVWWYLFVVTISSLLSALAWPLLDAVYTDILARMGREQIHMVGLKNATFSMSYIVGPVIAGGLATIVGELQSFTYVGMLLAVTSIILLFVTPKKLKLPQAEIAEWE